MRLAVRRFPDEIRRLRASASSQDDYGRRIDPTVMEETFRASVQPISLEDVNFEGGSQLKDRMVCYVPEPDALLAARDDAEADRVLLESGREYVVASSESWPGHTKAVLLSET